MCHLATRVEALERLVRQLMMGWGESKRVLGHLQGSHDALLLRVIELEGRSGVVKEPPGA